MKWKELRKNKLYSYGYQMEFISNENSQLKMLTDTGCGKWDRYVC